MRPVAEGDVRRLAEAYLAGEDIAGTTRGRAMARAHADRVERAFRKLERVIRIEFTERDPYASFGALAQDVRVNRRMQVFTGFSDTPLWSPEINWKSRAVHDYDHVRAGTDFSLGGEVRAFQVTAKDAPLLEPLYLSEIALQAAVSTLTGSFPEGAQKLVIPGVDVARIAERYVPNDAALADAWHVWDLAGALSFLTTEELMTELGARGVPFEEALPLVMAAETTTDLAPLEA